MNKGWEWGPTAGWVPEQWEERDRALHAEDAVENGGGLGGDGRRSWRVGPADVAD